ncbi:MAG: hypothetical protein HY744_11770 [Deltaproteobacteria bacterium]|nr:hypothetical protein [Deltaproteobacteria bacterium]
MQLSRNLIRSFAIVLALGIVPAAAWAQPAPDGSAQPAPGDRAPDGRSKARRFPMDGKLFLERVETRLAKAQARLEQALERRKVPPKMKQEIEADFAKGAAAIRKAAQHAAADGTVTREEAREVRELVREIRHKAREKYGPIVREARKQKRGEGPKERGQG